MENTPSRSGRNKRNTKRFEWLKTIQILWMSEPFRCDIQPITLEAKDISAGGMCLISRGMVHPGQFGIALLGRGKNEILIRGVEVRFCKYDPALKKHKIGCCWTKIPNQISTCILEHDHGPVLNIEIIDSESPSKQSQGLTPRKKSA